ncbi:hypothetical protein [Dokdonella immobilis]|uniref:ABC-2 type transport system permease protein n=1 Tax=Dokdonella immobilis TaxID=578942 RepID=A0A1I5AW97_9GAMM|nr:hypothetical protein [Dokdonella immobilis]SFN66499.1 hypothetical protein SAMN05216289_1447 [Dokdonella immobilis]
MGAANRFGAILVADLRERTRSTRFWVVLVALSWASWWCFPPLEAHYMTVSIGSGVRGQYSSAWIGMTLGLLYSTLMSLLGFYLVRGTLVRDFETRVWQLLVATPMTRAGFLLAKWTSHMLVFCLVMAIGLAVGLLAQLWRAEDSTLDLIELVRPAIWLSLPALSITALFAVLFDMIPWLRRSAGNVLYFVVWIALLAFSSTGENRPVSDTWLSDPNGIAMAWRDLKSQLSLAYPHMTFDGLSIGGVMFKGEPAIFEWTRWAPRWLDIGGRLLWVGAALVAICAMAPALDRAAARTSAVATRAANAPGLRLRLLDRLLRPLESHPSGLLFAAELKLLLRPRRRLWWLALVVLGLVQLFGSMQALGIACILAWLISTDVFARTILRERESGTAALLFSAAHVQRRMLFVRVGVALGLAVLSVLPALLRLSLGDPLILLALNMTAASIAVAGIAVGAACRNPRPFELLLVASAYAGAQGHALLNPTTDPAATIALHGILLPAFSVLLVVLWPRHCRVEEQGAPWRGMLKRHHGRKALA